jgi:two-component system, cell cycle sensor histidine kinase and response regulator CckA
MIPPFPQKSGQQAGGEGQEFLKIARQVSETIGAEFFSMLADQLAEALSAKCVYVGEFARGNTDRVRTLAACREGGRVEGFEFPLAGSPDAEVALGNPCVYARGVRETFPGDRLLQDLEAEAFVAFPLNDAEGLARGLIAALYGQPLDLEISFVQSMLKMFAPRASAELSRKLAEEVLRESEQRYRTFVQMNPDACWRVEFDEPIDIALSEEEQLARILRHGYVAECNDALVRRLGLERPDQLIGARITEVVLDNELIHDCIPPLIRSDYRHGTMEVTTMDGSGKRGYYLHAQWGIVENGKLQRVWGSSRDITELRRIEAQFRHLQKLESIGRLAAGVAHDFNNLLTIIRGYSAQMLESTKDADNAYIGLTEIWKAAEKGAALTNQLLAFSRKQDTELKLLDLKPIVAENERMLRRLIGKNIELTTELKSSVGVVRADAGCMHQVLLNLAVNARDAMPRGGRLIIALTDTDISENRPPRLAAVQPGPYVRLSVTDNGVGMSHDVQAHLFEPFFTTKEAQGGTGLGLSTVYGIVRQCGGYITVETQPNKGTTFEILFPRESSQD